MKLKYFFVAVFSLCLSGSSYARILKVVFTGGPGSGKSSSLNDQEAIDALVNGIGRTRIFVIPEAATPTLEKFGKFDPAWMDEFYAFLLGRQFEDERNAASLAQAALESGEVDTAVLVYDRAWVDNVAYWPEGHAHFKERYLRGLEFNELNDVHVLFFNQPPEKFYTTANNATRKESYAQALARSEMTFNAWADHGAKIFRVPVTAEFADRSRLVWSVIGHLLQGCEGAAIDLLAASTTDL